MKIPNSKKAFIRVAYIPICIILLNISGAVFPESSGLSVKSLIGAVTVSRGNATLTPKVGDGLATGDVIHLSDRSYMVIDVAGTHYKILGPKDFTVREDRIRDDVARSQSIDLLSQKLLKNTPQCNTRTITSGIRGIIDENAARTRTPYDLKERLETELNVATEKFRKKKYDEALEKFTALSKEKRLDRTVRMNCRLFAAEIHYLRSEYGTAFTMYREIYREAQTEYANREFCLVRAIVCAQITGNRGQEKALLNEYRSVFGKSGKYVREVNDIIKRT